MSSPTHVRFSDPVDDMLASYSRRSARSKSGVVNTAVSEWLRMQQHPRIRFLSVETGERRAALLDGPQVWTVVDAWNAQDAQDRTVPAMSELLGLSPASVDAALSYWADFRDEIDEIIERHHEAQDEALSAWERRRAVISG